MSKYQTKLHTLDTATRSCIHLNWRHYQNYASSIVLLSHYDNPTINTDIPVGSCILDLWTSCSCAFCPREPFRTHVLCQRPQQAGEGEWLRLLPWAGGRRMHYRQVGGGLWGRACRWQCPGQDSGCRNGSHGYVPGPWIVRICDVMPTGSTSGKTKTMIDKKKKIRKDKTIRDYLYVHDI